MQVLVDLIDLYTKNNFLDLWYINVPQAKSIQKVGHCDLDIQLTYLYVDR